MKGLNRLEVHQVAMDLTKSIYQLVIPNLPSEEKWCLGTQIRRASASIPANIAEGYGRYYYQETIRFCYLAKRSLMELLSHTEIAKSQGYISEETGSIIFEKADSLLKLIHGYINYLKNEVREAQPNLAPNYLKLWRIILQIVFQIMMVDAPCQFHHAQLTIHHSPKQNELIQLEKIMNAR